MYFLKENWEGDRSQEMEPVSRLLFMRPGYFYLFYKSRWVAGHG